MIKRLLATILFLGSVMAFLPAHVAVANDGCVIPESGPWPTCATGGDASNAPSNNNENCVIPESGPWPPCATNGGGSVPAPSTPSDAEGCVIPESGPWPPCATNGGGSVPAPAPTPDVPAPEPTPEPVQQEWAREVVLEDGRRLQIERIDLLAKESNRIEIEMELSNISGGFWPMFSFYDPDNCFRSCNEENPFERYPISSANLLEDGQSSGTLLFSIEVDAGLCAFQPETNRLELGMLDVYDIQRAVTQGDPIPFYIVLEYPIQHNWCE